LDTSEASTPSAASDGLKKYKEYIISKLPISDKKRDEVRRLLDQHGWPTVWQSLDTINNCENGLTWRWEEVDNVLLRQLRGTELMGWTEIAEYIFIGMRVS
jgi:hypothetical protein